MATQTHPAHPARAADSTNPACLGNPTPPAAHSAWIPLPYLRELVPLDLSENIQLSAINFNGYASFGYGAPQPDRGGSFFEDVGYPYCGEYFDTGLNEASEFRMRQAFDLQSWVCLDAVEVLMPTTDQFPPAKAARLDFDEMAARRQFVKKKRHLMVRFQKVKLLQLHNLVALAKTLFDRLLLVGPTDLCTTPFPAGSVSLMADAGIEMPEQMNAQELYRAVCRRLVVQEKEVADIALEILRDELQLVRMGLYLQTGEFLRAQAKTVMAQYHLPENALLITTEDDLYEHLEVIAANPIDTRWPLPVQPETSDELEHWE